MKRLYNKMSLSSLFILGLIIRCICWFLAAIVAVFTVIAFLHLEHPLIQALVCGGLGIVIAILMLYPLSFKKNVLDPRLVCPHCGHRIIPQTKAWRYHQMTFFTYRDELKRSYCEKCGKDLHTQD